MLRRLAAQHTCSVQHASACIDGVRWLSAIHYDSTSSDVEALLHETLDKQQKRDDSPGRVLTTKREALSLYRLIFRVSRLFVWQHDSGLPWRDVIRDSARREFEAARFETDPAVINQLLVVGRDAVEQAKAKFMDKRQQIIVEEVAIASGRPSESPM